MHPDPGGLFHPGRRTGEETPGWLRIGWLSVAVRRIEPDIFILTFTPLQQLPAKLSRDSVVR